MFFHMSHSRLHVLYIYIYLFIYLCAHHVLAVF